MFIIKKTSNAVSSVRDLITNEQQAVTVITPDVLAILKDTHEFLKDGLFTDVVCFQAGKLFTVAGDEVTDTQAAYKLMFDNLSSLVSPDDYGKVLELILNLDNKPRKRARRSTNATTKDSGIDLTEAVTEALKAGKIPTVSDGKRALLPVEHELAKAGDSDAKRNAMRKMLKELVGETPRFKTVQKWDNTPDDQRHDLQDWITAAKEKLGL